jgi:hypothetical protein
VTAWPERFRLLDDLSELRSVHLDPWRDGIGSTVTSVVPRGYATYVRILHPADNSDGSVRWSEIAKFSGKTLHPLAQWDCIIPDPDDGQWSPPRHGEPSSAILLALVLHLGHFTTTPDRCFFAIWDGWGDLHGGGSHVLYRETTDSPPRSALGRWRVKRAHTSSLEAHATPRDRFISERAAEAENCPKFEFEPKTGRPYLLGAGPLDVITEVTDNTSFDRPGLPVAMWWPADRAWFVASEIDFDSTLVAGSTELRDALLSSKALEAFEVQPDGILSLNGDTVNG